LIHNLSFDNKNATNNKFDKIVQINIYNTIKQRETNTGQDWILVI